MCGPRPFFLFRCGPGRPQGWARLLQTVHAELAARSTPSPSVTHVPSRVTAPCSVGSRPDKDLLKGHKTSRVSDGIMPRAAGTTSGGCLSAPCVPSPLSRRCPPCPQLITSVSPRLPDTNPPLLPAGGGSSTCVEDAAEQGEWGKVPIPPQQAGTERGPNRPTRTDVQRRGSTASSGSDFVLSP